MSTIHWFDTILEPEHQKPRCQLMFLLALNRFDAIDGISFPVRIEETTKSGESTGIILDCDIVIKYVGNDYYYCCILEETASFNGKGSCLDFITNQTCSFILYGLLNKTIPRIMVYTIVTALVYNSKGKKELLFSKERKESKFDYLVESIIGERPKPGLEVLVDLENVTEAFKDTEMRGDIQVLIDEIYCMYSDWNEMRLQSQKQHN